MNNELHPATVPEIDMNRVRALIAMALDEDLGTIGDTTTISVIPESTCCVAHLLCKEPRMVVAGLAVAREVFRTVDPEISFEPMVSEGDVLEKGTRMAKISGRARSVLSAERTALNFLQRLCGVATTARRYVDALAGTGSVVLDTRKTTPGYRNLEKYAVAVGGAVNHRIGLFDPVARTDNHREPAPTENGDGIAVAVRRAKEAFPNLAVEVEADRLEEVEAALAAGADCIMLDNMTDEEMAEAVRMVAGRVPLEASGGITIERLPRIGRLGVDYVSVGALTHSVKSADISLDVEVVK
ncbi:MAG: carboxylating nicotinate-nucleotide diphosphorylase [Victivallaceae bacterium]|nr:carboxylating nicotinate-nucleotide diphosphorylase [Victivallaceae bacterium]